MRWNTWSWAVECGNSVRHWIKRIATPAGCRFRPLRYEHLGASVLDCIGLLCRLVERANATIRAKSPHGLIDNTMRFMRFC